MFKSLSNKFEHLKAIFEKKADILVLTVYKRIKNPVQRLGWSVLGK